MPVRPGFSHAFGVLLSLSPPPQQALRLINSMAIDIELCIVMIVRDVIEVKFVM